MASTTYYGYTPSLIPAVIGVGLYFALFAGHAVRMYRAQAWDGIYMVIGALSKKELSRFQICFALLTTILYNSPSNGIGSPSLFIKGCR
jgi:hypothetical protein